MKKKRFSLFGFIFKILLIAIVGFAIYMYFGQRIIKPKDIGVTYTEQDYNTALEKTGIKLVLNGEEVKKISEKDHPVLAGRYFIAVTAVSASEKISMGDYDIAFENYVQKKFTFTASETTAFLNEIAPGLFWFEDIQVKVLDNGKVEGSSKVYMDRILNDLYSDVKDKIPVPLPAVVNVYGTAEMNITSNNLFWRPDVLNIGAAPLPEKFMNEKATGVIASHLERIYRVVPGFEFITLSGNEKGEFVIEAVIPQRITVNKK